MEAFFSIRMCHPVLQLMCVNLATLLCCDEGDPEPPEGSGGPPGDLGFECTSWMTSVPSTNLFL